VVVRSRWVNGIGKTIEAIGLGALALAAACTSGEKASSTSEAGTVCPATLSASIGAHCGAGAPVCSPQYACGVLTATATCVCDAGVYACADFTGKALIPDEGPSCPSEADQETCPATEAAAALALCTEMGLTCAYPTTCDASRAYDQCQCFMGQLRNGKLGLRFACPDSCESNVQPVPTPEAGAPDAGAPIDAAPSAPPDARADAPTDSPTG
jgi:hypothetical protein